MGSEQGGQATPRVRERGGLADCVRVIEHGMPDPPPRLSRRVRLVPLAVDVDGDTAAVAFVRRGVSGRAEVDVQLLTRRPGRWAVHGGGGGGGEDDPLAPRPPVAALGEHIRVLGIAGVLVAEWPVPVPRSWGWAQAVQLLVSAEVTDLLVRRRGSTPRTLPVLPHGRLVVVWRGRRRPTVLALGAGGEQLVRLRLAEPASRLPHRYRTGRWSRWPEGGPQRICAQRGRGSALRRSCCPRAGVRAVGATQPPPPRPGRPPPPQRRAPACKPVLVVVPRSGGHYRQNGRCGIARAIAGFEGGRTTWRTTTGGPCGACSPKRCSAGSVGWPCGRGWPRTAPASWPRLVLSAAVLLLLAFVASQVESRVRLRSRR